MNQNTISSKLDVICSKNYKEKERKVKKNLEKGGWLMVTLEMFERYSTCSHSKFINKSIVNPPSVFGLLKTTLEKSLAEKKNPRK